MEVDAAIVGADLPIAEANFSPVVYETCANGWDSAAIPPSIRRPWHVFDDDLEDQVDNASSQGVKVNSVTCERLAMVHNRGARAAFAALPVEQQRAYVEVSLMEVAGFVCWCRWQVARAQGGGAPGPKTGRQTDFEAWDLLDNFDKAKSVPLDPCSFLAGDAMWAPLLAASCVPSG